MCVCICVCVCVCVHAYMRMRTYVFCVCLCVWVRDRQTESVCSWSLCRNCPMVAVTAWHRRNCRCGPRSVLLKFILLYVFIRTRRWQSQWLCLTLWVRQEWRDTQRKISPIQVCWHSRGLFVFVVVALLCDIPAAYTLYLRDIYAWTSFHAATLRYELQIKLAISPFPSILKMN